MIVAETAVYALEMKRRAQSKGKFDGECRRTACRVVGARWWSSVEHAYYCGSCAKEIMQWSGLVGVAPMVEHTVDTEVKRDPN